MYTKMSILRKYFHIKSNFLLKTTHFTFCRFRDIPLVNDNKIIFIRFTITTFYEQITKGNNYHAKSIFYE